MLRAVEGVVDCDESNVPDASQRSLDPSKGPTFGHSRLIQIFGLLARINGPEPRLVVEVSQCQLGR